MEYTRGRVAPLVFAIAFAAYAIGAAPIASWLDSSEIVAASAALGIAHAPGHPVALLVGRAAALLPFGDVAFRVNLASAAAAAGAAMIVACVARNVMRRVAPALPAGLHALLGVGAGLGFALCRAMWDQATRAEVYALEALLTVGVLACALAYDERGNRRQLLLGALLVGLALANHHFVTLLVALPVAAVVCARGVGRRTIACATLLVVVGLAAYLYLPVRALAEPEASWGDPRTAARFGWTISARAFQKSLDAPADETLAAEAGEVASALADDATPAVAAIALVGAWLLARRRETRWVAALLGGIILCVAAGPALLGFDAQNPDAHGYLLPALASLFVLAAAGVAALAAAPAALGARATVQRAGFVAAAAAMLTAAVVLPVTQACAASRRSEYAADRWAHELLAPLPPGALLVSTYFETTFQLAALRVVEQARPDIALVDRGTLGHPGFAEASQRRHPELATLLAGGANAPLRVGQPLPIVDLAAVAAQRPIFIELAPDLDATALAHLVPSTVLARFSAAPAEVATRAMAEALEQEATLALEHALLTRECSAEAAGTTRMVLWHAFLRARSYCTLGRRAAASAALAQAERLAPGDATLAALRSDCAL